MKERNHLLRCSRPRFYCICGKVASASFHVSLIHQASVSLARRYELHVEMAFQTKAVNVLSFDGGGSRGVLEIKLLQHIMQAYSAMMENPQKISDLVKRDPKIESTLTRAKLVRICSNVTQVIHPTEVFDFLVGTSAGAIMAYLLVGGAEDPETGQRIPLSIDDALDMFSEAIPKIFKKKKSKTMWESFAKGIDNKKKLFTKFVPYTQDGLDELCMQVFGNAMSNEIHYNGCMAGAVARQFNQDVNEPDVLEIFDTKSETPHLVREIILGSTDAPILFETPRRIGLKNYIDGAVAGNCPLGEALPRALQIFGPNAEIDSVLSLAPPDPSEQRLQDLKYSWQKSIYFIKYLSTQLTYGSAVFADSQKHYKNALFIRATHKSEAATKFLLDETDLEAMLKMCDEEFRNLPSYSQLILDSAAVIAARTLKKPSSLQLEMLQQLVQSMAERGENANARYVCKTMLRELDTCGSEETPAKMHFYWTLGYCHTSMDLFDDAYIAYLKAFDLATQLGNASMQAHLMGNIGAVTRELGQLTESKEWHDKRLHTLRAINADSCELAHAMNSLGNCLKYLGDFDEALTCFQSAKRMLEDSGDGGTALSWVLNNMGTCLRQLKRYEEAKECFEASLKSKKSTGSIALTLSNLAGVHLGLGELDLAKAKYEEVLAMKRAHFGLDAENLSLAATLHNLGIACYKKAQFDSAQVYLNQALSMRRKFLGKNHVDIAKTLKVTGLVYHGQADYARAKQYLMQAYEMAQDIEGDPEFRLKLQEDLQNLIEESHINQTKLIELNRRESQMLFSENL